MKAMIAAVFLCLGFQAHASSFDDFSNTHSGATQAQSLIVKFKDNNSVYNLGFTRSMMTQIPVIASMNMHQLQIHSRMNVEAVLEKLRNHPAVAYVQLDHPVTSRAAQEGPDDDQFSQQWSMELSEDNFGIDALSAWTTYGTGGKDSENNDIVVAIMDSGVDRAHNDLIDNVWVNVAEIPDNGIDDDNNGYVDDINGWNAINDNGQLTSGRHGTHVAGTVGAKGNNALQVAGVNWDVKIMDVPTLSWGLTTATVLRAYGYALDQKKLWLETNGTQGANVVATNSSFGVDRANCEKSDYPAWNDIYNQMGEVGILSMAATANANWNIDSVGDVPTGCSSDYIIAVTNNRSNGMKNSGAGYGKETIDLAAPGTGILSTVPGNGTDSLTGTSMATPHVTGAVGFLMSVASQPFLDLHKTQPGEAALEMKRMILETVTKTEQFEEMTVSGGILNLKKAADAISIYGLGQ
jgi:subtilisin family serine protease